MNIYLFPLDSLDSPPVLLAMDDDDDGGGSVTAGSFPTVYINLSPECMGPRGCWPFRNCDMQEQKLHINSPAPMPVT